MLKFLKANRDGYAIPLELHFDENRTTVEIMNWARPDVSYNLCDESLNGEVLQKIPLSCLTFKEYKRSCDNVDDFLNVYVENIVNSIPGILENGKQYTNIEMYRIAFPIIDLDPAQPPTIYAVLYGKFS